jgi:hypothetical protein
MTVIPFVPAPAIPAVRTTNVTTTMTCGALLRFPPTPQRAVRPDIEGIAQAERAADDYRQVLRNPIVRRLLDDARALEQLQRHTGCQSERQIEPQREPERPSAAKPGTQTRPNDAASFAEAKDHLALGCILLARALEQSSVSASRRVVRSHRVQAVAQWAPVIAGIAFLGLLTLPTATPKPTNGRWFIADATNGPARRLPLESYVDSDAAARAVAKTFDGSNKVVFISYHGQ